MTLSSLTIPEEPLARFCQRWKIEGLALFGSALRDDFRPDSDIDLLVTFHEDANWGLLSHIQMQQELEALLGRSVDLVSHQAIMASPNWVRRNEILDTAKALYPNQEL